MATGHGVRKGGVNYFTRAEALAIEMGQTPCAFLHGTGTIKPPKDMVICKIVSLGPNIKINALEAEDDTFYPNTIQACHNAGTPTLDQGSGGEKITAGTVLNFSEIVGRWKSIETGSVTDSIICYFSK